jgi:hypothetical protein
VSDFTHLDAKAALRRQEARLRWRLLLALHAGRTGDAGGWLRGRFLADLNLPGSFAPGYPAGDAVEDEALLGLLRDLVAKGLAEESDRRVYRHERHGLDTLSYRITAAGISFVNQTAAPDPDIDDGRIPAPGKPR